MVFERLFESGYDVSLAASNVTVEDGAQFQVTVMGRFWFGPDDLRLLLSVAEGAGCDLQVSMPPNTAFVAITSPKERPSLTGASGA